jgi:hypothetical protein
MFINYYEVRNIIQMIFIIIFFNEHFLINNRFKNNIIAIFTMIFWNRCVMEFQWNPVIPLVPLASCDTSGHIKFMVDQVPSPMTSAAVRTG